MNKQNRSTFRGTTHTPARSLYRMTYIITRRTLSVFGLLLLIGLMLSPALAAEELTEASGAGRLTAKTPVPGCGLIFEFASEPGEPAGSGGGTASAPDLFLKIDLVKVSAGQVVQLKSSTLEIHDQQPIDYKFGLRTTPETDVLMYSLKIHPQVISKSPMQVRLRIDLFQGEEHLQSTDVTVKGKESVMVELMENKAEDSKISFRLTPFLKGAKAVPGSTWKSLYEVEKQFFEDAGSHKVDVDIKQVPIFAVDKEGNPVYDIKPGDLELKVNGKSTPIANLTPYDFARHRDKTKDPSAQEKRRQDPDRVLFIIIDQVFSDWKGIRHSKTIASDIVKKGAEGDFFILLLNTPDRGLKYLAGPINHKKKLLAKINSIQQLPPGRRGDLYSTTGLTTVTDKHDDARVFESEIETEREKTTSRSFSPTQLDHLKYRTDIQRFNSVLSQFKYALMTIDKPKIVFLISRGMARDSFETSPNTERIDSPYYFDAFLFEYFRNIGKYINQGGSVLYTINAEKVEQAMDKGASGEYSLVEIARAAGGRYFASKSPATLSENLNRNLSAYYELAFNPKTKDKDISTLDLEITCKRKGIRLHTIKHGEIERPYHMMEKSQKKIFALNVVQKGNWSRMVGLVKKASAKRIKKDILGKTRVLSYRVNLPKEMQNKEVDIFTIKIDKKKQKYRIDVETRKVEDTAHINIKGGKNQVLYFAVIEPKQVLCVYKQAK